MSDQIPWPLQPHTAAKHALLKRYLDCWFPILGSGFPRINYIDGFAGPGQYVGGEEGSPVLAVKSAMNHVSSGNLPNAVQVNFTFIESNRDHAAHLTKLLDQLQIPDHFKINVIKGQFSETVDSLLDMIEAEKKHLAPTFAFVDPFGFSGIPMKLMARILKFPSCEIFVNIMVDSINRFLNHPDEAITRHFPEIFGSESVLEIPNQVSSQPGRSDQRLDLILRLYQDQLKKHAKFVGRFDMRNRKDRSLYSLFFASNNPKGFEKMKEAMWSVDKYTGNQFSGADPNPAYLFDSLGYEPLWDRLLERFSAATVAMSTLDEFVVEKTDYLPKHARQLLKTREELGEITVVTRPNEKRRAKTFPPDKVLIVFHAKSNN